MEDLDVVQISQDIQFRKSGYMSVPEQERMCAAARHIRLLRSDAMKKKAPSTSEKPLLEK